MKTRTAAGFLFLLSTITSAQAATDLAKSIAACAGTADGVKRLSCYDEAAKAHDLTVSTRSAPIAPGKWRVTTDTSPIDDSKNVFLNLEAEAAVSGWLARSRPSLVLRCKENKTEAYVNVGMQVALGHIGTYGTQYHDATIRFDRAPAKHIQMTGSTDGKAVFFRSPVAVIKEMSGHEKMLFQFTPFNANPVITTFTLSGLPKALEPLRAACGW